MTNPYDLGKEIGTLLFEKVLTEQKKKRIVAVYAGRFQPFHAGHYSVYADMVRRFGKDNVFIATSEKIEPTKSPFSFDEKQSIITKMFDVPKDKIVAVKSPFAPEEILSKFDSKTTAVVTAFSEKDAGRLGAGKYYRKLPDKIDSENLEGYEDKGYYYVAPVHKLEIGGQNISGTAVRQLLGNPNIDERTRKSIFKRIYGKFDKDIFGLITKKTRESEHVRRKVARHKEKAAQEKEDRQKQIKKSGRQRITNPETGRNILVKTALSYDPNHPAHRAAIALRQESVRERAAQYNPIGENMISRVLLMKEGGAAGHMAHPFDDMNLTFGDLKTIVELGLEGHLNVEAPVTEKLDGQNISVSWRDDKGVIFARNSSHLKNSGLNAMDVNGVKSMFAGRGSLSDAFSSAAEDLQGAISRLTAKQRNFIFDNGKKFMSLEIIFPATQNVIPYGHNMLVFHNTTEYDDSGNPIGVVSGTGRILAGMIKQINQDIQKTFTFTGPVVVTLPKSQNFARRKGSYFGRITRLQKQFNLSDSDPVMMWHQRWWENFIQYQAKKFRYNMSNNVFMGLVQRWAFQNLGGYSVRDMRKTINDEKFLQWVLDFDKTGKQAQFKENIAPFEKLFLQLGAEILQNASGFISASPNAAAQQLKKELDSTSRQLNQTGNIDQLSRFREQLSKLNSIGMDKLVPTEGITFMYRGKMYKLTGIFAPLNQLLGIVKYGR